MSHKEKGETFILLLRGINVGGPTRSLPMKELESMLVALGCSSIKTYIQSGNVVINVQRQQLSSLSDQLSQTIFESKGFSPQILILSDAEFQQVIENNPFPDATETPSLLHLGFLAEKPENPDLAMLESLTVGNEKIQLTEQCFYHFAANGYGRSKVASKAEKLLGVPMTDRNWKTVLNLKSML